MNSLERQILQNRQVRLEITRRRSETAVSITQTDSIVVPDKRYRMLVTLIRTDRPRYWNFRCVNCGSKIAELQNREVYLIDDFYDPQNLGNDGIGRSCAGLERQCPYTYVFHLQ